MTLSNTLQSKRDLLVHSDKPYNAEPRLERLRAHFRTARQDFYVRTHGDIPQLDAANHLLRVQGQVSTPLELSMAALRHGFPRRSLTAVMQCAGNRRADLQPVRPTGGDPWAPGAMGNALWTGVRLADVLRAAGSEQDAPLHVAFAACDEVDMEGQRFRYGCSIPITKALSPEVLLAFEMNNEALAPEHGFPVRVVVPGYAGVRNAKWLANITVQDTPSDNHMQQRDYKMLPPDVTEATVDWDKGFSINDMPLNSAICEPAPHAELKAGQTVVRGYAVATARGVVRVDVSIDGGCHWRQAELEHDPEEPWSWTFWQAALELPRGMHELVVRAWDSAGQTQPARVDDLWNFKGYLCAAWHRVPISAL